MTITPNTPDPVGRPRRRRSRSHLHRRPDQPPAPGRHLHHHHRGGVRDSLKVLMAALALVGITGMYLRQVRSNGRPRAHRLRGVRRRLPRHHVHVTSSPPTSCPTSPRPTPASSTTSSPSPPAAHRARRHRAAAERRSQVAGRRLPGRAASLFGIALYRARVLPRWAAALLAVGGVVSVALAVMPDAFYRFLAFPNGIAMIAPRLLAVAGRRAARDPADAVDTPRRSTAVRRMNTSPAHAAPGPVPAAPVPGRGAPAGWWVPPALLALAVIPVAGRHRAPHRGAGRTRGPADRRSLRRVPVPLVVHIVAAVVYAVLGAFQFSARLRRRHPGWHRRAGRLLVGPRSRGRVLRAVDDAGLPPEGRHRRHPLGDPAAGQLGRWAPASSSAWSPSATATSPVTGPG